MQPIVIQDSLSIAANTVNENVIASNNSLRALLRLPTGVWRLSLAMTQGATAGLIVDFNIGSRNVVANSAPKVDSGAPQYPLDVVNGDCYGEEGDILVLRVTNTTGGAVTFRYMVRAEEIDPSEVQGDTRVIAQGPVVIAAGTVDKQLLDGLRYERAPNDSILNVYMTSSAAGLTRQVFIDMDRVAPSSTISIANRMPQDPFDLTVQGIQVPKDSLIQIPVSNPTAGDLNILWRIMLKELSR